MIDRTALQDFVAARLEGTDYFPVEVTVSRDNVIDVVVDSETGVDIDFCISLSRAIEEAFPRDDEDYELQVGSAGLTSPLKVRRQYDKNIGNRVEVLTRDGRKLRGTLAGADDEGFDLAMQVKVKPEGAKRPVLTDITERIAYGDAKSVRCEIEF